MLVTISVTCWLRTGAPPGPLPVIVSVKVPRCFGVIVSVAGAPFAVGVTVFPGDQLTFAPGGWPLTLSVTGELYPFSAVSVTV